MPKAKRAAESVAATQAKRLEAQTTMEDRVQLGALKAAVPEFENLYNSIRSLQPGADYEGAVRTNGSIRQMRTQLASKGVEHVGETDSPVTRVKWTSKSVPECLKSSRGIESIQYQIDVRHDGALVKFEASGMKAGEDPSWASLQFSGAATFSKDSKKAALTYTLETKGGEDRAADPAQREYVAYSSDGNASTVSNYCTHEKTPLSPAAISFLGEAAVNLGSNQAYF